MHSSILLLIASLVYLILTMFLYHLKDKRKTIENNLYSILLIVTIFGVIIDILGIFAHVSLPETSIIRWLIVKLYLLFLLTFLYLVTVYIIYIGNEKEKGRYTIKNTSLSVLNVLYIISFILNFILPFEYFKEENIIYVFGPNCTYLYGIAGICILGWNVYIFCKRKTIKKRKILPMVMFSVVSIPIIYIQMENPELLLVTALCAFLVVFLYHTIENPDLKMIEKLDIAKTNAEKANRAKSDFLSSMSHEIRTPLNAVVGFSECILQEDNMEDIKRDAKDVIMATQNLLEIVNGILDISKIEANKMEIVETEYELLPTIENIAKLMIPRIGEKPIELNTNFAVDIPYKMHGDIGKIKQIITNILTNAVKYTEKGEINFNVNCINEDNICSLVISVEDTGRGIKEDKLNKLFSKFDRLDEDKNTTIEGTGLGLAITKSLVTMLGGKIIVQSVYGQGSKFTVYLKQNIVELHSSKTEEKIIEEETIDFKGMNILVVDDNTLNLRVADKLLKKYGISTTLVDNGIECINKIKEGNKYDLILLDDMMPKLSGTETIKILKQLDNFNMPVVALTANAISGEREKYLNLGFNEYLAKPINKVELEKVLSKFLQKNINTTKSTIEITNTEGNVEYLKDNGIDIDTALSLLGDIEMYNETLKDFKDNLNERVIKLKRFKDAKDMPNYAILVHSLKSDCKYLGFTKLAEMSYDHELKSKANDIDYISNNFNDLAKECMRIRVIIDKY